MEIGKQETTLDRPCRELEGIIEHARRIDDRVKNIAERLRDMRRRILGMEENLPEDPAIKEVVCSEVQDLRDTLNRAEGAIESIEAYVSNLEGL